MLGSPRLTIDIDFIGDDVHLERFVPLPEGNEERVIRIGQFGNLEVFVVDPHSIALSKLDRGLDTDFDDLVFLIQNNHVT